MADQITIEGGWSLENGEYVFRAQAMRGGTAIGHAKGSIGQDTMYDGIDNLPADIKETMERLVRNLLRERFSLPPEP